MTFARNLTRVKEPKIVVKHVLARSKKKKGVVYGVVVDPNGVAQTLTGDRRNYVETEEPIQDSMPSTCEKRGKVKEKNETHKP